MTCRQIIAPGQFRLTGGAHAKTTAFLEKPGTRRAMNGTIHATAAKQ